MKQALLNVLNTFVFPVFLHGSLDINEPFPSSFFTFQVLDSPDKYQFDDAPTKTAWEYQVIFYSDDPHKVEQYSEQSRTALKAAGFIPQGKGHDIPSEEPTHTGWINTYFYLANY